MSLINSILEQLINGLRTGSIYALIALILLALMFTAHHQLKRHYKQKP